MKKALLQIDWFKDKGFALGRDKSNETYYVVDGGTGKRYDFGSIEQAETFVIGFNAYRYQTEHPEERL
jgi:hypothetical protein